MQRRIVLFVLTLFASACSHNTGTTGPSSTTPSTPTAGPSTVAGQVVDQSTKGAIAAAALTLVDPAGTNPTLTTKADGAGNFSFANVTAGTYSLQTVAAGYSTSNASITVPVAAMTIQMLRTGVQPTLPLQVLITGAPSTMTVGQSVQLTATLVYTDGSKSDVTSVAKWSSDTPAVATVTSSGLLTAFSAGTATIGASSQSVSGTTPTLTVVKR